MKVRMKISISGLLNGQPYPKAGEVFDVADVAGASLCADGFAEPMAEPEPEETATPSEPETATAPEPETPEPAKAEERKPRSRKRN